MKENRFGNCEWSLEEGRAMIGQEFVLKKPMVVTNAEGKLMECMAGAPCKVRHLVDYGEGLLLYVEAEGRELNQFDRKDFAEYFREKPKLQIVA